MRPSLRKIALLCLFAGALLGANGCTHTTTKTGGGTSYSESRSINYLDVPNLRGSVSPKGK